MAGRLTERRQKMLAIYKKELKTYFTSMMGCIFIAFCLAITSLYFCLYNMYYAYPNIYMALQGVVWFFIILIPILTMRIISEEQRNKTDQLLYTAPVPVSSIVLGKYFSMLTIFAIPVAVVCFFPVIISKFGEVSYASSYLAILAYFLIGAAFIAVGMFISSITESQIIAAVVLLMSHLMTTLVELISGTAQASLIGFIILIAVLCVVYFLLAKNVLVSVIAFVVLAALTVVLYFVNPIMFEGAINDLLKCFCLTSMADNLFSFSILDITAIVYYVTVIAFFVFITVQSIQKKRWN